jgi:hypothetical protein
MRDEERTRDNRGAGVLMMYRGGLGLMKDTACNAIGMHGAVIVIVKRESNRDGEEKQT